MKKLYFLMLFPLMTFSQVGINTTNPQAQLEIQSSNQVSPANTDGLLIPKVDAFPAINPTATQQGMLVYLTTTVGSNSPGFYYWDNPTTTWIPVKGKDGGTLDEAYDFGGAGTGKTITADAGAVLISGTDGLVSTGTLNTGAIVPSGSGTRMVWNPRKAAFRAGRVTFDQWDDANIGENSAAFGVNTKALGQNSFAAGSNSTASGQNSTAFGNFSTAIGHQSFSNGLSVVANGLYSTVFGESSNVNGTAAFSIGRFNSAVGEYSGTLGLQNTSSSFGELVVGLGATLYTPSTNGATQFSTANSTDRLFVIGNAIDANNSNFIDTSERSDAMIVLKNGLTRLPSTTNTMINAADGKAVVTKEWVQTNAIANAWGLTGNTGTNSITNFIGTTDNQDITFRRFNFNAGKIGTVNTSFGVSSLNSNTTGVNNSSFGTFSLIQNTTGEDNTALGKSSLTGTTTGSRNTVVGANSFTFNMVGNNNTSLGFGTTIGAPNLNNATAIGALAQVEVSNALVLGSISGINGASSNVNVGIGTTSPLNKLHLHTNSNTELNLLQFTNPTAGFLSTAGFLIGINQTGVASLQNNINGHIDFNNGQMYLEGDKLGIGSFAPQEKLHVVGNIRMVDGNQAAGKVLTSDANGTATWQNASANAWGLTGNSGTNPSTNFIGTLSNPLVFKSEGIISGRLGSGNTSFGQNSLTNHLTSNIFNAAFGNFSLSSNTNGQGNTAIGNASLRENLIGSNNVAIGINSLLNNISGNNNVAIGSNSLISENNINNTAIGSGTMTGNSLGSGNTALGFNALNALSVGSNNTAIGNSSDVGSVNNATAIGALALASTSNSVVLGSINGINGATATVNVGVGTTSPQERLHIAGKSLFENGFSSDNGALLYKNNTDYMFIGPQSGSTSNGGGLALFGSTNNTSGNPGGMDINVPSGSVRLFHSNGSYTFSTSSTSNYSGLFELNDVGFDIGHNSISRAIIFSPGSTERMRLTPGGFLGVGATAPARRLHVSNGVSGGTSNGNTGILLESSGNVYQHFLTPSTSENGLLFGSELASINGGIIFNNSAVANGIQFRTGGNSNRMTITSAGNVGIGTTTPAGQLQLSTDDARKSGTSTWTIVSDTRLKNIKGNYTSGLNEILQLHPVRYQYKNNGERKFEEEVLDTEYSGFIAQEVQTLFPEAVGTDEDGYLNLNIHPILIASVNAFKELNTKYEDLKTENEDLKSKLELLLKRIETLEKK